jgi:choline-sulfatase
MNVILYMPETMRAESLACYGHPLVRTPNLDRLADEGVRFDNCYAQNPICGPSRCSLMTGWYLHVPARRWSNSSVLHPHQPSLFRYLHEAGYVVGWHGKNDLYAPDYFSLAVDRAFGHNRPPGSTRTTFDVHQGEAVAPVGQPGHYNFLYQPYAGPREDFRDVYHVDQAIDFLRSRKPGDDPFCLYLPLSLVHPPYCAPAPYYHMYDPDQVPELRSSELPARPCFHRHTREHHELDVMPPTFFRQVNAVYLGMVTFADWIFGRLLDALDETGLAENTAVFVFSDHGDYGGDYGLVHKHPTGFEDVMVRVPLIARVQGMAAGHTVTEPVELFDVMATSLELAGIEPRHRHFARSLVPQLRGAPGDPARTVYAEGGAISSGRKSQYVRGPESIYHKMAEVNNEHPESRTPTTMLRTLDYKLIYRRHDQCELYDMQADPRELHNLYDNPDHAALREALERQLLQWYVDTSNVPAWEQDPRVTPTFNNTI